MPDFRKIVRANMKSLVDWFGCYDAVAETFNARWGGGAEEVGFGDVEADGLGGGEAWRKVGWKAWDRVASGGATDTKGGKGREGKGRLGLDLPCTR